MKQGKVLLFRKEESGELSEMSGLEEADEVHEILDDYEETKRLVKVLLFLFCFVLVLLILAVSGRR